MKTRALPLLILCVQATFVHGANAQYYYGNDTGYRSSFGSTYQYDLNRPMDQLRYSVDMGAQLKDSIDPRVELDRSMGQYGGGIR